MVFIRETVGIIKMRIFAAEKLRTPVHKLCEFFYGAGNFLGNSYGHFVGRLKHHCHQCLVSGEFFSGGSIDAGISGRYAGSRAFGNNDAGLFADVFTGQKRGHDLCDTGRVKLRIPILGIKNGFRVYIHKNGSLGFYAGACGPAVNGICIGSLGIISGVCDSSLRTLAGLTIRNRGCGDNRIAVFIIAQGCGSTAGHSACKQNSHTENTCKDPAHGSFFHNVHHKIPFK